MHSVLSSSQIHRSNRQTLHHGFHLVEREAIGTSGITVAKRASEIALIGETETERDTGIGRESARRGRRRPNSGIRHRMSSSAGFRATHQVLGVPGDCSELGPPANFAL